MNFSSSDFVSPDEILAEVLIELDEEQHNYISPGGFVSQMQKCLTELSFDTFFNEITHVEDIPQNLNLDIPKGMFNLRRMYLFNGPECNAQNSVIVRHKRQFYSTGKGPGYLANNKGNDQRNDAFFKGTNPAYRVDRANPQQQADQVNNRRQVGYGSDFNGLYWYEIQRGIIMLSSNCLKYTRIAMVYNGIHTGIGDKPLIPLYLRETVKDWCVEYGARIKRVKDKQNSQLWSSVYQDANRRLGRNPFRYDGTWYQAEDRVKKIDSKEREDIKEYMSKLDY